ncbi:MAG: ABC transporter permease [Acidobacteriaceae bacterium]
MKTYDLVELASRNLRESKLRNGLTTLGIAVGVASLVAMLSLGVGLQQLANSKVAKSGLFDTVFVTSPREFDDHDDDNNRKQPQPNRIVDEAARQEIAKIPNVVEVAPEIRVMTDIRYNGKSYPAFMGALPQSAKGGDAFESMQGTFFSSPTAKEAIVQKDFAKTLEPKNPNDMIGKEIVLRYAERHAPEEGEEAQDQFSFSVVRKEQPLKVVGIIDQEPFGGMRMISRARLFLPTEMADSLNMVQFSDVRAAANADTGKNGKTYSMLTVKVSSAGKVEQVQEAIKKLGLRTYSILDASKSLRKFFGIFDMFLGVFGSLALAVASLAIVNTLVMAVLERRREIGIMKSLGAGDGDVKKLFFAEAGVMGLVGGVLGVALGWLMGRLINFGTVVYMTRHNMSPEDFWAVPWWLVGWVILFAVGLSLLAALYPAARAAKLDPIQALRYE